jgi:hypothetical protein
VLLGAGRRNRRGQGKSSGRGRHVERRSLIRAPAGAGAIAKTMSRPFGLLLSDFPITSGIFAR